MFHLVWLLLGLAKACNEKQIYSLVTWCQKASGQQAFAMTRSQLAVPVMTTEVIHSINGTTGVLCFTSNTSVLTGFDAKSQSMATLLAEQSVVILWNTTASSYTLSKVIPPPPPFVWLGPEFNYVDGLVIGTVWSPKTGVALATQSWPDGTVNVRGPLGYMRQVANAVFLPPSTLAVQLSEAVRNEGAYCGSDNQTDVCLAAVDIASGEIASAAKLLMPMVKLSTSGADNTSVVGLVGGLMAEWCTKTRDCYNPTNNYRFVATLMQDATPNFMYCMCNPSAPALTNVGAFDDCDQRFVASETDWTHLPMLRVWSVSEGIIMGTSRMEEVLSHEGLLSWQLSIMQSRFGYN